MSIHFFSSSFFNHEEYTYLSYNSFMHLYALMDAPSLTYLLNFHNCMTNLASSEAEIIRKFDALYKSPSFSVRTVVRFFLKALVEGLNPAFHNANRLGLPGLNQVFEKKGSVRKNILNEYYQLIESHLELRGDLNGIQKDINNVYLLSFKILLNSLKNPEVKELIQEDMVNMAQTALDFSIKIDQAAATNEKIIAFATRLFTRIDKYFSYAAIAALFPIGLGLTFIYINRDIWVKTVTPDDVNRIVEKAFEKENK